MQKKRVFVFGALALVAASLPTMAADLSASAEAAVYSRYVFRGIKLGGAAFQPTVCVTAGAVDVGFWGNYPFAADESVERDYTLGYSRSVLGVDWRATAQAYTYPQASAPATERTYEFGLAGSRQVWGDDQRGITVAGAAYYDVRLDALTFESSLTHDRKLLPWLAVTAGLTAGQVAAYDLTPDAEPPKCCDSYSYFGAKAEARVSLGEKGSVRTGVSWDTTKGLNGGDADLGGNTCAWAAIGWEW